MSDPHPPTRPTGAPGPYGPTAETAVPTGPGGDRHVPAGRGRPDGSAASGDRAAPDGRPGVVVRGLHRSFGSVRAVDGVDLDAPAGSVTALVGPNGSGKTTLLLVLAGLLRPDAGTVRVAGWDPVTRNRRARTAVGWMPDVAGTWDSLTVREVLLTVAETYRLPRAEARDRARELLAEVHLTELGDAPARVLSRGQKQRLGLARALVHRPPVLLLDEPASGLDPRSRVELRRHLRSLAADGVAVVVSSHVLAELDETADRAVFLARGRAVAAESVRAARSRRRLWRIAALDPADLAGRLTGMGIPWQADDRDPDGAVVRVDGLEEAARLITDLVARGVHLHTAAPATGGLEETYMALEEDRR